MGDATGHVAAKLRLLQLADELGNIRAACEQTGFSRDSYYRFKKAYARAGVRGLSELVRSKPRPGNRVAEDVERAVMDLNAHHPDWGAGRISHDLEVRAGIRVSPSGVRSILLRTGARGHRMRLTSPPEDAPPPRPKRAESDMAAQILNEAFALFAQKNFSIITMKDIAEAVAINPSLIHYYFRSKEALFLQVVEKAARDAHRTFLETCAGEHDPARVIRLWIRNHSAQFLLMQNLIKISVDYANTHGNNAHINQAIRKFYEIEAGILNDALREGIRRGLFRPVDIGRISTFISTFLDGVLIRSVMFPEFDHKAAIEDLAGFVEDHLNPLPPVPAQSPMKRNIP